MGERLFLGAVVALQLGAAIVFAAKREWPKAVMLAGAAVANGAAAFLK